MNKTAVASFLLFAAGLSPQLSAKTYYVDAGSGNDRQSGTAQAPFRTTKPAIKAAEAGDTIVVVRVDFPIPEEIVIENKSGAAGKPITIDGQGNLFTGSDPINPADWTEVRPGLFRNGHLLARLKKQADRPPAELYTPTEATLWRYYFIFGGKQIRMGRSSKGLRSPLVPVDRLAPGQWTYVFEEAAFYVAIPPGTKLADSRIEAPVRENGVTVKGDCAHWVFRNLNVTRVINDGFNIHGRSSDMVYDTVSATECGDDGISQHANPDLNERSECVMRNFVSRRNSTGIANMGSGTYENVVLEDNYGQNLYMLGGGTHEFHHCTISARAPKGGWGGILLEKYAGRSPVVRLVDCKIPGQNARNPSGATAIVIKPPGSGRIEVLGTTKLKLPVEGNAAPTP